MATKDPSQIPKLQSPEESTDRLVNLPGIYRHRDTGAEYITAEGEEGVIQADALMTPVWKDAWERVGDVPSRVELMQIRKLQLAKDLAKEAEEKAAEEAEIEAIKAKVTTKATEEKAKEEKLPEGGETYTPQPAAA